MTHRRRHRLSGIARFLGLLGAAIPAAATPDALQVIEALNLESHVEGGYFRRTYQPEAGEVLATEHGPRFTMTSIFYLLTEDSPVGHFHRNRSDIVHYFQLGDAVDYYLLYPDGRLEHQVLGHDLAAGQRLQLTVPGGIWKASRLRSGGAHGYGLVSEAVSPGFDYRDMTLGERAALLERFPEHSLLIRALTRPPKAASNAPK